MPAPLGACRRCGAVLRGEQAWCLSCGSAVRSRVVATAAWRRPLLAAAAVAAAAFVAIALAFVLLTRNDNRVPAAAPVTTTAPASSTVAP
jgi:hypothetical protein